MTKHWILWLDFCNMHIAFKGARWIRASVAANDPLVKSTESYIFQRLILAHENIMIGVQCAMR